MIWKGSPNFTRGRAGRRPDVIVIHVMEGTLRGTDSWFASRKSKVSAHYAIGLNGAVHQYVNLEDQAWHAGRVLRPTARIVRDRAGVNPNLYTVGIEHEGTATSVWPQSMYEDSAELVATVAALCDIPIDRDHVIGHREIYAGKSCPGAGDVDRIVEMARALEDAPESHRVSSAVFTLGDRGPLTEQLQDLLVAAGYMTAQEKATGPGIHGPRTDRAFKTFLAAHS